ncbi:hypothetical protein CTM59_01655 [Prevotella intermedia]|uniref:Uncharacterized protein n=1 Tax=Prevotella intermedia TaxID=28131 RepID=A0A2M8TPK8_PREIN|nr:hypothetical protein CTM59_01655 [Prevotella intermedia]
MHGKNVGFASQNSRFRNAKAQLSLFKRIIFTKTKLFSQESVLNIKRKIRSIHFLLKHSLRKRRIISNFAEK